MSLLDGRTTVDVLVPVFEDDEWGTRTQVGVSRQSVPCTVQWGTPGSEVFLESEPNAKVTVLAKQWPGVDRARFEWEGRLFEQEGPAKRLYGSRRTQHFEVQANLISEKVMSANG